MVTQYYALTQYGTTKENPSAIARLRDGIFERYRGGEWVEDIALSSILIGEFNDYENITEAEAFRLIRKKEHSHAQ